MNERPAETSSKGRLWGFVALMVVLLTLTVRVPRMEGWDEAFYVAQMTSLVGDGDLLLHDDLLAFGNISEAMRLRTIAVTNPVREGALANNFGIGPAMIHSFYLWPRVVDTPRLPRNLRIDYAIGGLILLALTLLATRSLLLELGTPPLVAGASALAAVFLGPLAVYGTRFQLNSHLPAAFCGAMILFIALRWMREGGTSLAVLLGFFFGLGAVVRWQDLLLVAVMAPCLFAVSWGRGEARSRAFRDLGFGAAAFLTVLAIQAIAFERHNGQIAGVPQGSDYMSWTAPRIGLFLLSPMHGLIPWTPVFALGLVFVFVAWRRAQNRDDRFFLAALAVLILIQCYVSAAPADWFGGASFSARRLTTLTAVAAVGIATLALSVPRALVLAGGAVAVAWSILAVAFYGVQFDDLAVIFFGRTSPENPFPLASYPNPASLDWRDIFSRPDGFSLVGPSRPSALDRLIGFAVCALACAFSTLGFQAFNRSRRVRAGVAGVAVAWTLVCLTVVWRAPSNDAVNRAWISLERGTATEATLEALPHDAAAAGRILLAWKALRAGDLNEGRALLDRARSSKFPPFGPASLATLDETLVRVGER